MSNQEDGQGRNQEKVYEKTRANSYEKAHTNNRKHLWSLVQPIRERVGADNDSPENMEFLLCGLYCLVALFFLIIYGIAALMRAEFSFAYVIFGFAVVTLVSYISIWLSGYLHLANHFIVILLGALCLFLFYTGGAENTGPVYFFVFPMIALFLQGNVLGLASVIGFIGVVWIIQSTGAFGFDQSMYSWVFFSRISTVYVIVSILTYLSGHFRNKAERELLLSQGDLEQISYTDKLTGLANHNLMERLLHVESNRFQRYHSTFCVLVLSIDNLPKINNKLGSAFGEYVLKITSVLLMRILRRQDIPSYWEKGEFLVILSETNKEFALVVGERLRSAVEKQSYSYMGKVENLTASIGIEEAHKDDDVAETVHKASSYVRFATRNTGNYVVCSRQEPY